MDTLLILGDFNYHYDKDTYPITNFKNTLKSLSIIQHITFPTHFHNHILDLIITSDTSDLYIENITKGPLISNHFIVKFNVHINYNSIIILSYGVLNIHLLNRLKKLAQIRKFKVSYHPQTPWFSKTV